MIKENWKKSSQHYLVKLGLNMDNTKTRSDVEKLGIVGFYQYTRRIDKNAWDITKRVFNIEDKDLIAFQALSVEVKMGELL